MVSLSLFQNPLVRKEIIANYYTSAYSLPFGKKLAAAFSSGWEYFLNFLLFICHLWVFMLAGFVFWACYKHWQQKRKIVA
jgi:hypothetical protein